MSEPLVAAPGLVDLREAPPGMPDPAIQPPTVAEPGDPFADLRIVAMLARLQRGRPVRLDDIVDTLNATYLDWAFTRPVVDHAAVQLQANWMADYRSAAGIQLEDGEYGPVILIEDSSRVDPWLVAQARRIAAECRARLVEFSRLDRLTGDG